MSILQTIFWAASLWVSTLPYWGQLRHRPTVVGAQPLMIVLWGILTPLAFLRPETCALVLAGTWAGYGIAALCCGAAGFALPLVAPLCYLATASAIAWCIHWLTTGRLQRRVRAAFLDRVSNSDLKRLVRDPDSIPMEGDSMEATAFFSDIANFTALSGQLSPRDLVGFLNAYLAPMSEIILDHDGFVDKYEGDSIMAVWGAPVERADHAAKACLAALEQRARLEELRPALMSASGQEIRVRMGLDTGTIVAAAVGAGRQVAFTIMGEAVHHAAIFEPANKEYGTTIIIGERTFRLAEEHVDARLLDKVVLGNAERPILIYELLGRKGELSDDRRHVVEYYEKALKIHWYRQFDKAIDLLNEGLSIDGTDAPSIALKQRMDRYKRTPPHRTWQGEYLPAN